MSLDVIKNLKSEVETLKKELETSKAEAQKVEEIEKELGAIKADLERKSIFGEEKVSDKEVAKAEKRASDLQLKSLITGRPVHSFAEFKEVASVIEKAIKPTDISDWMAEKFSQEIIEKMELELKIEKLFDRVIVPDGVQKLSFPKKTGSSTAYLIQPAQDAIESAITVGKVSFEPVKIKTLVTVADETQQEAVVASLLNVVKEDIAYSLAKASEVALINGDLTGGINGNPAATDVSKAFNGLRKYGYDVNKIDNGGGVLSLDTIRAARKSLGVFGIDPSELVLVVNPTVYYQLLNIENIQTIDKIGNAAVLKTGTIAMIDGINIVLSEKIPVNLNTAGEVDTSTPGTLTGALLFNRKTFRVATRETVSFEQDRSIINDTNWYTARRYLDFKQMTVDPKSVAYIVNVAQ